MNMEEDRQVFYSMDFLRTSSQDAVRFYDKSLEVVSKAAGTFLLGCLMFFFSLFILFG